MELLKITKDDPNFQAFVKERLNYTMDRVRKKLMYDGFRLKNAKIICPHKCRINIKLDITVKMLIKKHFSIFREF